MDHNNNATSCGTANMARLHEIGEIQSCGYLLAVEEVEEEVVNSSSFPSGLRIIAASQNVEHAPWVDVNSADELSDKDLGYVFHAVSVETVRCLVARHKKSRGTKFDRISPKANRNTEDMMTCPFRPALHAELHLPVANKLKTMEGWTCTVAISNPGVYLIEVERKDTPHGARQDTKSGLLQAADLIAAIPLGADPEETTAALCAAFADAMPAYESVMVYRLAPDGSGEVITECIRPGFDKATSFLNLRFPATDMPPKTREMLKLNGVRFIADTSTQGVPVCIFEERITALDLSMAALRGSPECHLGYLRNMGVKASMAVGIIVDGELWGVFACHCYTAVVHPLCEERIMVDMAATIAASLISNHRRGGIAITCLALSRTLGKLGDFTKVKHFFAAEHKVLLNILDVDTIILSEHARPLNVYGNKEVSLTLKECKELVRESGSSDGTVVVRSLETMGVAFFSVRSFIVVFLRGSVVSQISWAGKPDLSQMSEADGPRNPRASFGKYMAESALDFKAWSPINVDLLEMVSHGLASRLYAESLPVDLQETFEQVSHELRTPFHGVMGSLEVLQATHSNMKAGERLGIIQAALKCGGSMLSTLNNILDIAKDCSNIEVAQDRFLASSPIFFTVTAMTPFATSEGLDLLANIEESADGIVEVIGDERRIKAILQNIVTNAIKFTAKGGMVKTSLLVFDSLKESLDWWTKESHRFDGKVLMGNITDIDDSASGGKPSPLASETKWHVFCVEDSGAGVLPGNLPHLVAPYRQMLHGAHPGTGLGLHICKEYVDLMHGALGIASTLSVEGKPGGGTMFSVVLPFRVAGVEAEPPVPLSPAGQEPGAVAEKPAPTTHALFGDVRGRNLVFLVADDHVLNTKLLQHKIAMFFKGTGGYHVDVQTSPDGVLALDKMTALQSTRSSSDGAALVGLFVDFQMPILDGVECTRRARLLEAEHDWPRTTIYGYTANPTDKMRELFLGAGGDGVISKPWQPGQVEAACVASVQKFIEEERRKAAGGAWAAGGV